MTYMKYIASYDKTHYVGFGRIVIYDLKPSEIKQNREWGTLFPDWGTRTESGFPNGRQFFSERGKTFFYLERLSLVVNILLVRIEKTSSDRN